MDHVDSPTILWIKMDADRRKNKKIKDYRLWLLCNEIFPFIFITYFIQQNCLE